MLVECLMLLAHAALAAAQFPPKVEGVTILQSKFHENVTISFKEPGICETTPGVKSYAGYVHLPPGFLQDGTGEDQHYPINTFFWFFEARNDPKNAPLSIWLNGGAGASSMMGLLEELGPCLIGPDSATTILNPFSWNNDVNMIFIDQPNQVGFSYDVPTNGTQVPGDDDDFEIVPGDFTHGVPRSNLTHHVGTFASQKPSHTANATATAAHAIWHFAQTWFFEFPHYKPSDDRISLWAESYGGHYGPAFARFFQEQNAKISTGAFEEGAHYIHFDTLGIVNGLIDTNVQFESSIEFSYNNTYGIQLLNKTAYDELMNMWSRPGGCRDLINECQNAIRRNQTRQGHQACDEIHVACDKAIFGFYFEYGRGFYDIAHPIADPFPPPHLYGYLRQESVLAALGVPVNYSAVSAAVGIAFGSTFDLFLGGFLDDIAYLLDSGVNVHMMYGDRDPSCNWRGAERVSLAVPYSTMNEFQRTGYAPVITADGVKGMTRQLGNFSFTRVFQAGHEVPAYQPLAALAIFNRATFHKDIATGLVPVFDELRTFGPKDVFHIKNEPPSFPKERCYILKPQSCTLEMWKRVVEGNVTVRDYFVAEEGDGTALSQAHLQDTIEEL